MCAQQHDGEVILCLWAVYWRVHIGVEDDDDFLDFTVCVAFTFTERLLKSTTHV